MTNTTHEEFELIATNLCKQTGKYEKECINFINQYGQEIYQLIVDDLDAESFCQRIGVCPGGDGKVGHRISLEISWHI